MIKQILKKVNISDGMKNVAKISTGTMAGQALSFLTLPIYTRIYGAEVIGNWALFTSIATIINSFSDAGLSNAIMIEKTEEDRYAYYVKHIPETESFNKFSKKYSGLVLQNKIITGLIKIGYSYKEITNYLNNGGISND